MSSPNFPEADRETHLLWPADARIRNLTYGCNLYTDVTVRITELDEEGKETNRMREVPVSIFFLLYACYKYPCMYLFMSLLLVRQERSPIGLMTF